MLWQLILPTSKWHWQVLNLYGVIKAGELDWSRVVATGKKNAARLYVPMYDTVAVAVPQSFQHLAHVVAAIRMIERRQLIETYQKFSADAKFSADF